MNIEVILNSRIAEVEYINNEGSLHEVKVGDKIYKIDVIKVENGIYSILFDGKSYDMEVAAGPARKKFHVSHHTRQYPIELVDAETKYAQSRGKGIAADGQNSISSPMPGKVVKIPIKVGDDVNEGQTLIIISAMKMESEYKAGKDAVVKEIKVKEGDTIEGNQVLIELE